MKIGMRLKRILAPILCIAVVSALFFVPASAAEETAVSSEIEILSQLGVLGSKTPDAKMTKELAMKGLNAIMKNNAPGVVYFDNQNLNEPLLYGQAVMVLVDALGYSHYVEMLGYDPSNAESYINTAKRIKLVGGASKSAQTEITVSEWAELLYKALTDTDLMKPVIYGESVIYKIVEDSTMLEEYMKLEKLEEVVKGVDNISIATNDGEGSQRIKLGNVWYTHTFTNDMYKYFGCRVEAYVDAESRALKAIALLDSENNIVKVSSDDIVAENSTVKMTFFENEKRRTISISQDADFMYNRELVVSYTAADLNIKDCNYTLIDNDANNSYDIIIAEKYTAYVTDYRQTEQRTVVDKDGITHDYNEYYKLGNKMYDEKGIEYGLNLMHEDCVVSELITRSGRITNVVVTDDKYDGYLTATRDNMKYVSIDGVEVKTAAQYNENLHLYDKVKLGDKVLALPDANGRIISIAYVDATTKAAYFIAAEQGVFDAMRIKALDEDGKMKILELSGVISVDGDRVEANNLLSNAKLSDNGKLKQQLVIYKQTADGRITMIDTPYERNVLGECGYEEFTLNYKGTLRCMALGGNNIFGTKYVLHAEKTKVFNVVRDSGGEIIDEQSSVVGGSIFLDTESYNLSMYNVNNDFVPEFALYESTTNEGSWVNVRSGNVYMIESISESVDNNGEVAYIIESWGPDGKKDYRWAYNGELTSAGGRNWSYSWSPDSRLWKYKLKDLPKGSIVSFQNGSKGIAAFVAHHIPLKDNVMFEKTAAVSGNYQGLDTNKYNAGCLMSFGKEG